MVFPTAPLRAWLSASPIPRLVRRSRRSASRSVAAAVAAMAGYQLHIQLELAMTREHSCEVTSPTFGELALFNIQIFASFLMILRDSILRFCDFRIESTPDRDSRER